MNGGIKNIYINKVYAILHEKMYKAKNIEGA